MMMSLKTCHPLKILVVCLIIILSILYIFSNEQQITAYKQIPHRPSSSLVSQNVDGINSSVSSSPFHQLSKAKSSSSAVSISDDYNRLIDLQNFDFVIDHKTCTTANGSHPLVVILIHSAPGNFLKRQAIRDTWGQKDDRSLLLFLFGTVNDVELNDQIVAENEFYDDIVQGNFIDAYRNMTYKHVMGFKWFKYTCKHPNFVLKTDDDVLVNSPFLYESLEMFFSNNQTIRDVQKQSPLKLEANQLILCDKFVNLPVYRNTTKWAVTYDEFSRKVYPPYCPGFAILYSADVVKKLYDEAQITRYFWIDDVFCTGILTEKLNITITQGRDLFLTSKQMENINANKTDEVERLKLEFLFSKSELSHTNMRKMWSALMS